jgi:signal peptidase II
MPSTGSPPPPSDRAAAGVRSPAFRLGLGVAGLTLLLDQLSKWWILAAVMQPPRTIEITSFFNIVLVWNRGVSFGLFNQPGGWNAVVLSIVALAVVVVLLVWMARTHHRLTALALGLIVGGAIGNVIDRLRFGAVVDFLDVHYAGWHWPAFNVADSGISMGAALLIAEALFFRARSS